MEKIRTVLLPLLVLVLGSVSQDAQRPQPFSSSSLQPISSSATQTSSSADLHHAGGAWINGFKMRLRGGKGSRNLKDQEPIPITRAGASGTNIGRLISKRKDASRGLDLLRAKNIDNQLDEELEFLGDDDWTLNQLREQRDKLKEELKKEGLDSGSEKETEAEPFVPVAVGPSDPLAEGLPQDHWWRQMRPKNESFDIEDLREEMAEQQEIKRLRERELEEEEAFRQSQIQREGAWNISQSACEAWDWFQGRSSFGAKSFTTFRNKKYGYVVQLYDNSQLGWITYSRMTPTKMVHVCYSHGEVGNLEHGFYGQDLVDALVNMTAVQGRQMPFKVEGNDASIVFRHSYWYGKVDGPYVTIQHMKKEAQRLYLTPEGFVFVGQPAYFQGGRPEELENEIDPQLSNFGSTVCPLMGPPLSIWVQGPRRAREMTIHRAQDLLEEQARFWQDGDREAMYVAHEAAMRDPVEDARMGNRSGEVDSDFGVDSEETEWRLFSMQQEDMDDVVEGAEEGGVRDINVYSGARSEDGVYGNTDETPFTIF